MYPTTFRWKARHEGQIFGCAHVKFSRPPVDDRISETRSSTQSFNAYAFSLILPTTISGTSVHLDVKSSEALFPFHFCGGTLMMTSDAAVNAYRRRAQFASVPPLLIVGVQSDTKCRGPFALCKVVPLQSRARRAVEFSSLRTSYLIREPVETPSVRVRNWMLFVKCYCTNNLYFSFAFWPSPFEISCAGGSGERTQAYYQDMFHCCTSSARRPVPNCISCSHSSVSKLR